MKLKAIWNEKTKALEYSEDDPGISYSVSFIGVHRLPLDQYIKLESASTIISGRAENTESIWMCPEAKFREIMGWSLDPEQFKLEDDGFESGGNVVWQSTDSGSEKGDALDFLVFGYDNF